MQILWGEAESQRLVAHRDALHQGSEPTEVGNSPRKCRDPLPFDDGDLIVGQRRLVYVHVRPPLAPGVAVTHHMGDGDGVAPDRQAMKDGGRPVTQDRLRIELGQRGVDQSAVGEVSAWIILVVIERAEHIRTPSDR